MIKQTSGRDSLGEFAPKFAQLNDDILFGEVWSREDKLSVRDNTSKQHGGIFGMGEPNTTFAKYFIGNSYLKPLTKPGESTVGISNVTFEPRCRNNWHIHHASRGGGQILVCVEGEGWYQEAGKEPKKLKPGDIVVIPANVKHWHGAANCWFSHLAMEVPGENTKNEWCEPVCDEEYNKLI